MATDNKPKTVEQYEELMVIQNLDIALADLRKFGSHPAIISAVDTVLNATIAEYREKYHIKEGEKDKPNND